jgi:Predicted NADH:ubiquinone oxidoreductase, subunit RnfA
VSYLGLIVTSTFASNALLAYGLGSLPGTKRESLGRGAFTSAFALATLNAVASCLLWCLHAFVLSPLGFPSLDILFFVLIAVPLIKCVSRAAASSREGPLSAFGAQIDDLLVGSLVFGVALISSRSGYSLPEALVASACSGLGYWLAQTLLEAVRLRLELSDLPAPFKGSPAMLLSAGLMALAFMGIDAAFVQGLAG